MFSSRTALGLFTDSKRIIYVSPRVSFRLKPWRYTDGTSVSNPSSILSMSELIKHAEHSASYASVQFSRMFLG